MMNDELVPELRVLEGAVGTPAVLGDGNTWLLADGGLSNAPAAVAYNPLAEEIIGHGRVAKDGRGVDAVRRPGASPAA